MSAAVSWSWAVLLASGASGLLGVGFWRASASAWAGGWWRASALGTAALAVIAWVLRWREAGHLPLFGTFESALSLAAAVLVLGAFWEWRRPAGRGLSPALALVAAAILWHGLGYETKAYALTISERSWVVDVHAFVAWAAFAVLGVNAGLAALTLWGRTERAAGALVGTLEWGFFLHTAMLGSGAAYRFLLFGRAWAFDPIETLGFVAWLSWGTLLHLHFFARWKDRRLAAWSLGLFLLVVISYRGIVYFPSWATYHVFDIGLREHLMR